MAVKSALKNEQTQTRRNLISSEVALESPLTKVFFELIATPSRLLPSGMRSVILQLH